MPCIVEVSACDDVEGTLLVCHDAGRDTRGRDFQITLLGWQGLPAVRIAQSKHLAQ